MANELFKSRITRTAVLTVLFITVQCVIFVADAWGHPGYGIVVNKRGEIYFSDIISNTIWRIDAQGSLTSFVLNKHAHGLMLDEDDNLYGEDNYTSLWKATPEGAISDVVRVSGTENFRIGPFTIDRNGNVYVWKGNPNVRHEAQILKMTPDRNISIFVGSSWGHVDGTSTEAKFRDCGAMAWGSDGSLYITEGGYGAVRKVSVDGTVSTLGGYPLAAISHGELEELRSSGLASNLMGLTVDALGNVYVADNDHSCIRKIMSNGEVGTAMRSSWFWSPTGVTLAASNLYVLEYASGVAAPFAFLGIGPKIRVQRISSDGTVSRLATVWGRNTYLFGIAVLAVAALTVFAWRSCKRRNVRRVE